MEAAAGENEPPSKRVKFEQVAAAGTSSAATDRSEQPGIGYEYDVFLSFRGEDTRKGFTDSLYNALVGAGIRVYRDNERLEVGEEIGPALVRGIKQSNISIPIFSTNYASSKWCLQEFALMMECREERKQVVLPVFYDVKPGQVRHQSGSYGRAFRQHGKKQDPGTVKKWKEALALVGTLKGWELANEANGHEGQLIKMIVTKVLRELKTAHLLITDELVGVETQVDAVMKLLEVGVPDVRFIGICGMGGIGKTTLAKVIYNKIIDQFDSCSFLQDIRETSSQNSVGLRYLQSQLVADLLRSDRRDFDNIDQGINELKRRFREKVVLILLDDVDHADQLGALAASHDWFARGSRIIVTARNMDVLRVPPLGYKIYEVRELEGNPALQLFCKHALRKDAPTDNLEALSKEIVERTGGLPLALKVIGSFLCGKREAIWRATSQKLKVIPNMEVVNKLRISYDGLEHEQQQVFLDIACLFIGEDKTTVSYMWEDCFQYSPEAEIEVLLLASLVRIGDDNKLRMHDQLRDLGREIVRQENFQEPGRRSRLWSKEAVDVLEMHQASVNVEAIRLNFGVGTDDLRFTPDQFRGLSNLRFLQLIGANLDGDFRNLLRTLRWLRWQISSADSTVTNLNLENLVILDLSLSRLTHDWTAWSSIQKAAVKLKVLDLNLCTELTRTPDFSKFRYLERLSLRYCVKLSLVDPSIGNLRRLNSINMESCWQVKELPELRHMKSLRELIVNGTSIQEFPNLENMKRLEILSAKKCRFLSWIPDSIGQLTSLTDLMLDETGITELPESIGSLAKLRRLTLSHTLLTDLPATIGGLTSLVELVLSWTRVVILPDAIENSSNLEVLKIDHTLVRQLPPALGKWEKLETLDASGCPLSKDIPMDIGGLSMLRFLLLRRTEITSVPRTIKELAHLEVLDLAWCKQLKALPELPISLISLSVTCQSMIPAMRLPDMVNLRKLEFIRSEIPEEILLLQKLEKLRILRTSGSVLLDEIGQLSMLKELSIGNIALPYLPKLPGSLQKLRISHCDSLQSLADVSGLQSLSGLRLKSCPQLVEIEGLGGLLSLRNFTVSSCGSIAHLDGLENLESLASLNVTACGNLDSLPDLSKLRMLYKLKARYCKKLAKIEGVGSLYALEDLDIRGTLIDEICDMLNLKSLKWLRATGCTELRGIDGLDELEKLVALNISGCPMIERLTMWGLKLMQYVLADDCEQLRELDGLDDLTNLLTLNIRGCKSLERLPDLSTLKYLECLYANGCEKLRGLDGIDQVRTLVTLDIRGCKAILKLPNLSGLGLLEGLFADGCENLGGLEGIEKLESLQRLSISGCTKIRNLPNLSELKKLKWLNISGCKGLREIQGLEELESVEEIRISGCDSLAKIPDLPNARIIDEDTTEGDEGDGSSSDEESDGIIDSRGAESEDVIDSSDEESDDLDESSDEESHGLGDIPNEEPLDPDDSYNED